jgi:hypothetical protein
MDELAWGAGIREMQLIPPLQTKGLPEELTKRHSSSEARLVVCQLTGNHAPVVYWRNIAISLIDVVGFCVLGGSVYKLQKCSLPLLFR